MDKEITKKDYEDFLKKIVHLIEKGKQQAFSAVNRALIQTYWNIGKEIVEKQKKLGWGVGVVEKLSADLKASFPDVKGYSKANLWNMKRFYETYEKLQTLSGELIFNSNLQNIRLFYLAYQKSQSVTGKLGWNNYCLQIINNLKLQTVSAKLS